MSNLTTRTLRTSPRLGSSRFRRALARTALFTSLLTVATACGDDGITDAPVDAGAYTASSFTITPDGQSEIDVLTSGGSLSITIGANNTTTGVLFLPESVTGSTALNASMAGTVARVGDQVSFVQASDTFVRDLLFTVDGAVIRATNQRAGSAVFTVVLTR
jgi:hypothetical protein